MLTALRDVIRDAGDRGFPAAEMRRVMAQRGKSLEFSTEEIQDLADMAIGDRRIFSLLASLSPFIDLQRHQFHIDHIFPKSRFTRKRIHDARMTAEEVDVFMDCADRIATFSCSMGPATSKSRRHFRRNGSMRGTQRRRSGDTTVRKYLLGQVPGEMSGFLDFYEARRARLQDRISDLVNSV